MKYFPLFILFVLFSNNLYANQWVKNVKVTQLGTYQYAPNHYVWLSVDAPAECKQENPANPTLYFSESNPGGKSMLSVLMTAIATKSTVDVQVKGCDIVEVYIR